MPRVTGLRATRGGRVAVEVEGERWRTLPLEVVVEGGLAVGIELTRPLLRTVRRGLRRHGALQAATRALRARPLSVRRLDERLRRAGFVPSERAETIGVLRRAGFLDDERFALMRAEALAERCSGNALIRHDLLVQGIDGEIAEQALGSLEPETSRAARIAASRGSDITTARYLARRGFGEEAVEAALTVVAEEA